VDIFLKSQGIRSTNGRTGRIPLAEVALDGLPCVSIRDNGGKRADKGAHLAAQTSVLVYFIGTCLTV